MNKSRKWKENNNHLKTLKLTASGCSVLIVMKKWIVIKIQFDNVCNLILVKY
jgi:hypothetical protein